MSSTDHHHRQALDEMGLCPFQIGGRSKLFGCMLDERASRINDVLIKVDSMLDKALPEEVLAIGERSDHLPLLVSFHLRAPRLH